MASKALWIVKFPTNEVYHVMCNTVELAIQKATTQHRKDYGTASDEGRQQPHTIALVADEVIV